jgi:hypothetical protein
MPSERKLLAEQCTHATRSAVESIGGRGTRAAIRDRALRDGGFTAAQLDLPGPPSKPSYPRLVDYYLSWSLTWLKKAGVLVNEGPCVWSLAPDAPPPSTHKRELSERQAAYRDYLRSAEWKARRDRALHEGGNRCRLDASHTGRLEVHHNSYERLGSERSEDLVVLCDECHRRHHGYELAERRRTAQQTATDGNAALDGPIVVDVAARHAELAGKPGRRWPWSRRS